MFDRRTFARCALPVGAASALIATWLQMPASTVGAGPVAAAPNQATVAIEGGDYYFAAPDVIEGGLVTIQFTNVGVEPHHAQLVRARGDVTIPDFMAALQGDERAALGMVSTEGGAAAVATNLGTEVTVELQEGVYALICFIPTPSDRIPHFAKGMIRPLLVTAPTTTAEPPVTAGTLLMRDFSFDMPETVPAGSVTYRVVNEGPAQPHEIAFVRLAPGKTVDDVRQSIMNPGGPPPFQPVGGFQATEVAQGGYVTANLEPGEYAAICQVTDPNSGMSHVHLGMVKGFRVV
jgi:plastocyanin